MKLIIIAITVVVVVIGRFIIRTVNKVSQGGSIAKIKKNPALAASYLDALDFPYNKKECDAATFDLIRKRIRTSQSIGKYKVLYAIDADDNRTLVFTELSFADISLMPTGKAGDFEEKAFHDFAVVFNPQKSEIQIYSSTFSDSTNKFQKQEFLQAVMGMDVR